MWVGCNVCSRCWLWLIISSVFGYVVSSFFSVCRVLRFSVLLGLFSSNSCGVGLVYSMLVSVFFICLLLLR